MMLHFPLWTSRPATLPIQASLCHLPICCCTQGVHREAYIEFCTCSVHICWLMAPVMELRQGMLSVTLVRRSPNVESHAVLVQISL